MRHRTSLRLGLAITLVSIAVALAASAGAPARPAGPCGASAASTIAAADATMANRIYRNELAGTEVSFDRAQITGARDLLAAVASGNRAATLKAVVRIVYHRHWHIVRMRALDRHGRLLADVGGPYVIAPVTGVLRSGGHAVGSFVMSVQDDVGETKLETRFVGDPVGIYLGGKLVAQSRASLPPHPPSGHELTIGGVRYVVVSQFFNAFPSGTLEEVLLVRPASSRRTCAVVRAAEFGRVAELFAALAQALPQNYFGYASTVTTYTGAEVFVRRGATQLATTGGPGPLTLPASGTVSYRGTSWLVFSFDPAASTRVYLLITP